MAISRRDHVIGPYLLTKDAHQQECLLHFLHDQPAGEHVETEQVQVGSSFQEADADVKATDTAEVKAGEAAPGTAAGSGKEGGSSSTADS